MNVILYTTGCSRCSVLEKKLAAAGVNYEEFSDVDKMIEMGMSTMPVLEVDGERMDFREAVKWVSEY